MAFENFKLLPYANVLADGHKMTRQKQLLTLKLGDMYPGEGHCSVILSQQCEEIKILSTAGTRRSEPAPTVGELFMHEFIVEDDNVTITNVSKLKTKGE